MPQKDAQTGMTEDQAVTALRARPAAAQKALLARMSPEVKQKVLAKLTASPASKETPPTGTTAQRAISPQERYDAEGSVLAQPSLSTKGSHAIDHVLDVLPTAAGLVGSFAGGGKELPTGVGLAAFTGGAGEALREELGTFLYTNPERLNALPTTEKGYGDFLKNTGGNIAKEAALQGGGELLGRGVGGVFHSLLEKIGLKGAAASQAAARAGEVVQKTPGEVSGSPAMQAIEKHLGNIPGAMGPMKRFAEKRAAQAGAQELAGREGVTKALDGALNEIGKSGLSREAQGNAMVAAIKNRSERQAAELYTPLKLHLGLAANAKKETLDAAAKKAGPAAEALLQRLDKQYALADETAALDLASRVQKPEAAHAILANTSLQNLRRILPTLPEEVRSGLSRSILEDALNAGKDASTGQYNVKAALKALDKLDQNGPKTKMLFGEHAETVRASLRELEKIEADAAKARASKVESPFGTHGAAMKLLGVAGLPASSIVLGTATGHPEKGLEGAALALGGEALAFGGARVLAEAITNPETAMKALTWLRRLSAGSARTTIPLGKDLFDPHSQPAVPVMQAQ